MWEEAEMLFDYVDANGDGEIDWPELKAVLEEHEPEEGEGKKKGKGKGKKEKAMIQLRNMLKHKNKAK
jgi:Ca2+-binding EF-hand superfamily protein